MSKAINVNADVIMLLAPATTKQLRNYVKFKQIRVAGGDGDAFENPRSAGQCHLSGFSFPALVLTNNEEL